MDEDFRVNFDDFGRDNDFGVDTAFPDFGPEFGFPFDAPHGAGYPQERGRKETQEARHEDVAPFPFSVSFLFSPGVFTGPQEEEMTRNLGKEQRK